MLKISGAIISRCFGSTPRATNHIPSLKAFLKTQQINEELVGDYQQRPTFHL